LSGEVPTRVLSAPPLADLAANRRQLDLFVDGADALLVYEIETGLISRDAGAPGRACVAWVRSTLNTRTW
jgi:hypothetical protein